MASKNFNQLLAKLKNNTNTQQETVAILKQKTTFFPWIKHLLVRGLGNLVIETVITYITKMIKITKAGDCNYTKYKSKNKL